MVSLPTLIKNGHIFDGLPSGVIVKFRELDRVFVEWDPVQPFAATGSTAVERKRPVLYSLWGNRPAFFL